MALTSIFLDFVIKFLIRVGWDFVVKIFITYFFFYTGQIVHIRNKLHYYVFFMNMRENYQNFKKKRENYFSFIEFS